MSNIETFMNRNTEQGKSRLEVETGIPMQDLEHALLTL